MSISNILNFPKMSREDIIWFTKKLYLTIIKRKENFLHNSPERAEFDLRFRNVWSDSKEMIDFFNNDVNKNTTKEQTYKNLLKLEGFTYRLSQSMSSFYKCSQEFTQRFFKILTNTNYRDIYDSIKSVTEMADCYLDKTFGTMFIKIDNIELEDEYGDTYPFSDFFLIFDTDPEKNIYAFPIYFDYRMGHTHPHIDSNGKICLGHNQTAIRNNYEQGMFDCAYLSLRSLLHNYNPESPYIGLEYWTNEDYKDYDESEEEITPPEKDPYLFIQNSSSGLSHGYPEKCSKCGKYSWTYYKCGIKKKIYCRNCTTYAFKEMSNCPACNTLVQNSYLVECEYPGCNSKVCPACIRKCRKCNKQLCDDHIYDHALKSIINI